MEILFDIDKIIELPECAATIGVFDGVHAGHQLIINQMLTDAKFYGYKSMVITFDRQPRELFDTNYQPQLLTTLDEKKQLLEACGVDYVVVLPFTMELAQLSARDFMHQVLSLRLHVKLLRLGYDNRFGRGRTEGFEDYERYGEEIGMKVFQGIPLSYQGFDEPVSSSLIRRLVADKGAMNWAATMLTRPYQLAGRVMPGEHIGHTLGFPTANMEPEDVNKLIPVSGVYAVWAMTEDGQRYRAMMNIGTRPTFEGQKTTLEVNIFGFDGNLYGKRLTVCFVERLREERRFESPEALIAQLEIDKKHVEQILNPK